MIGIVILLLFVVSGLVIAAISLILARSRKSKAGRVAFSIIALLALIAQGGCWSLADRVARANEAGRGGAGGPLLLFAIIAGCFLAIWTISSLVAAIRYKGQ